MVHSKAGDTDERDETGPQPTKLPNVLPEWCVLYWSAFADVHSTCKAYSHHRSELSS